MTTSRLRPSTAGVQVAGYRRSSSHPGRAKSFIDSTPYDHTSILKFIEWRWGLAPLTTRDAFAWNLLPSFDFGQPAQT